MPQTATPASPGGPRSAQPPQPRTHQCSHRSGQRCARLHPHGGISGDVPRTTSAGTLTKKSTCTPTAQYEIYRPFVKRAWRVETPELFPEIDRKGFSLAETGQQGPVLVDVPMNIFSAKIDPELFARWKGNDVASAPALDKDTAVAIVEALVEADNPVLYVGGGILLSRAEPRVAGIRRSHGVPGRPQPDGQRRPFGRSSARPRHDRLLGNVIGQSEDNVRLMSCLRSEHGSKKPTAARGIGATRSTSRRRALLHIDIDPSEIGRNFPAEIGAVADARSALRVLSEVARERYPDGFDRRAARRGDR